MRTVSRLSTGCCVRVLLSDVARHPAAVNAVARQGPLVVICFLERYLADIFSAAFSLRLPNASVCRPANRR